MNQETDNLKVNIVSYDDILKSSYENEGTNQIIIGYKPVNEEDMADYSAQLSELLGLEDEELAKVLGTTIEVTDDEGNPVQMDCLKYYTYNEDNILTSLTMEELIEMLKNNTYESPIIVSEKELGEDAISSDLDLVIDSMNNIVGYIKEDGSLSYASVVGEAGIFGAVYDVINYYKSINDTLYSGVISEAEAIAAIAEALDNLDTAAEAEAEEKLSNGSSGGGGAASKPVVIKYAAGAVDGIINGMHAKDINTYTKKLLNETRDAAISTKYNDISNLLGTSSEPGKVGKISVSKLGETIDTIVPTLKADAQSCTNMIASMDDFLSKISDNGKLKGSTWKDVKQNINYYKSLLTASVSASEFLSGVITAAKQMIQDFLYPDDELDDSELPKLEKTLEDIRKQIADLTDKVTKMKNSQKTRTVYYLDPKTQTYDHSRPIREEKTPSDAEIASVQASIDNYTAQAEELELKIKRIYDYADVVNRAQKLINDSVDQVKKAFENPVRGLNGGNKGFRNNFKLDLSLYGLTEGSTAYDLLKGFIKGPNDVEENYELAYIKKSDFVFDTSNMSDKAKKVLEEVMASWPPEMEKERYLAVQNALSLLNKGISYSMDQRHAVNRKTGMPVHLDCSSFVEYCLKHAGQDINARKNVYTGTFLDEGLNQFVDVSRSELQPGDVGLFNTIINDGGYNHAGLYLGKDNSGNEVWIEMSAMPRKGHTIYVNHSKAGYEVTRRYIGY